MKPIFVTRSSTASRCHRRDVPAGLLTYAEQRALDAVWSLGDVVGYGPQPNEVIARLAEHAALSVSGNHDLAASGRIDTADFNGDAAIACAWCFTRLRAD